MRSPIFFLPLSLTSISPHYFLQVAPRYDLIPSFIHIGISCINYGPLIVPESRSRSPLSCRFSRESLSGAIGLVPTHGQRPVSARCSDSEINRCLCNAVTLSRTSAGSSRSPESNPFHRSHKVLLTFKIHSSGFIHWSEVVRAPKTNRGLRSGISDGQVPRTHHWSHTVGHNVGDNTRHEHTGSTFFPNSLLESQIV